ncbi:MAG TPA: S41 family peptidase [Polyangium sp.]|nr:S41 family peptidase [Polyangium sp.]
MTNPLPTPPDSCAWRKRTFFIAALLSLFEVSCARLTPPPNYVADFDQFCADIAEHYAYFHERPVDWSSACGENRPFAEHAVSRDEFIGILEKTLGELHDFHTHLGTSNSLSPRLVPTESDLRVRWQGGRVVITDVRATSAAEKAGARPGMEIADIDGQEIALALAARQPKFLRATASEHEIAGARDWALNQLVAGKQNGQPVRLTCGYEKDVHVVQFVPGIERPQKPLTIGAFEEIGYIRIHNSLGEQELVQAFDSAIEVLRVKNGLILDLRDTPSGGNSSVARGLLGHFVDSMRPYQMHEDPRESAKTGIRRVWIEQVLPREPIWKIPVVVLVGAWTGSMGEGLAIGFNSIIRAPVIGERMAGLLGALDESKLPVSGIVVRFPTERLFHVEGTPREAFKPCSAKAMQVEGQADGELAYALEVLRGKREVCPSAKVSAK